MHKIITRNDARAAGLKRFYTGRPCIYGHDAERITSTGGCTKCNGDRSKKFASGAKRGQNARLQGLFTYQLHPDDHAAALAYCQALDLGRGRTPQLAKVVPTPEPITPERMQQMREQAATRVLTLTQPTHTEMDPGMAALLRGTGLLK